MQYKLHVYIFIILIKNSYVYQLFFAGSLILKNIPFREMSEIKESFISFHLR